MCANKAMFEKRNNIQNNIYNDNIVLILTNRTMQCSTMFTHYKKINVYKKEHAYKQCITERYRTMLTKHCLQILMYAKALSIEKKI